MAIQHHATFTEPSYAGNTGARTPRIVGLASSTSTAYTTKDITLDGTTPVTSSGTWYKINRAYILTAGTNGTNAGNITIRHTTTTTIRDLVAA